MHVLLTGATTIAGPYVLKRLLMRGDTVSVLAGPETADNIKYQDRLNVFVGRLTGTRILAEAIKDAEIVYHLAGLVAVPGTTPFDAEAPDARGLKDLLSACVKEGRRFVYTSTVTVYRPAPWPFMWPIPEDAPRKAHGNPYLRSYGQSRIDAENLIRRFHRDHGLEFVILRPTVVYAPGVPFIEYLLQQIVMHPRLARVQGAKLGTMQWVHAEDMAEAVVLAGTRPKAANEVFNVAGSENVTIESLMRIVQEWIGYSSPSGRDGFYAGNWNPDRLRFHLQKAQRLLGYMPKVQLREGLAEILVGMESKELAPPQAISWSAHD